VNRRSLFGAIALSPFMAAAAFAKEEVTGAPPEHAVNLTLMGTAEKEKKQNDLMYLSSGPAFNLNLPVDPNKSVAMAVGDDGMLWLKSKGGQWKRVVTE